MVLNPAIIRLRLLQGDYQFLESLSANKATRHAIFLGHDPHETVDVTIASSFAHAPTWRVRYKKSRKEIALIFTESKKATRTYLISERYYVTLIGCL